MTCGGTVVSCDGRVGVVGGSSTGRILFRLLDEDDRGVGGFLLVLLLFIVLSLVACSGNERVGSPFLKCYNKCMCHEQQVHVHVCILNVLSVHYTINKSYCLM